MIIPQPEADLSLNIMIVGADIIKILKDKKNYIIIDDLLKEFLIKDKKRTHTLFFDTVTFLYSLDLIAINNYKVRLNYDKTQQALF